MAHAAVRRGRRVRRRARPRRQRRRTDDHVGHLARAGDPAVDDGVIPDRRPNRSRSDVARIEDALHYMGLRPGDAHRRDADRLGLHRLVRQRPPERPPRRCRRRAGHRVAVGRRPLGWCPVRWTSSGPPRPKGSIGVFLRRRLRVARTRLLDVPRRRMARGSDPDNARCSTSQPELRRAPGSRGAGPISPARTSQPPAPSPVRSAPHPREPIAMTPFTTVTGVGVAVPRRERRHRRADPDQPSDRPHSRRARTVPLRTLALARRRLARPRVPVEPGAPRRCRGPRDGRELRLRELARTRRVGDRRSGIPVRHRAELRRHLPCQLLPERRAPAHAACRRGRPDRPTSSPAARPSRLS